MKKSNWVLVNIYSRGIDTLDQDIYGVWVETQESVSDGVGIEKYRPLLSVREYDVAQLISEGYSQRKAAEVLGISRNTVKESFRRVKKKITRALDEI